MSVVKVTLGLAVDGGVNIPLPEAVEVASESVEASGVSAAGTIVTPADLKGRRYVWDVTAGDVPQRIRFGKPGVTVAAGQGWTLMPGTMRWFMAGPGQTFAVIEDA